MSYPTDELDFRALKIRNMERLPHFKNNRGETAHEELDGSDWTILEWVAAMCGEAGEAANVAKKIRRGDTPLAGGGQEALADELADTVIYADLAATRAGINLGEAVRRKWNKTSEKIGYSGRL